MLLSRTETLLKLLELRKIVEKKHKTSNESIQSKTEIKDYIDNLIYEIVGLPEENRYFLNEIISKVLDNKISTNTAVVAIHEIYKDYYGIDSKLNNNKRKNKDKSNFKLEKVYKNGYR